MSLGWIFRTCIVSGLIALSCGSAFAQDVPAELKDVGIVEHLGSSVEMSSRFRDESGKSVSLAEFARPGHPLLLALVYYQCPNLCNFLLNGLVDSLKTLDWTPGNQFDIVTVSINPQEGPELASAKKAAYLASYGRPEAARGWHFLTGAEPDLRRLAGQVGFGYKWDPQAKQYAHSAAIFALTPEGRISRYLYGIQFREQDLRLALVEASSGRIGTVIDRILLFCYRYDPQTRKYSVYLMNVMRGAGLLTVLIFGSYLAMFWFGQRRLRRPVLQT